MSATRLAYNTRVTTCPGPSSDESSLPPIGYTSLSSLQQDLNDYFASFQTKTPTSSPADITSTANSPTSITMPSDHLTTFHSSMVPTSDPEESSLSEIPRPTYDPTGGMFTSKMPTSSPHPTIEVVTLGDGASEGGDYDVNVYPETRGGIRGVVNRGSEKGGRKRARGHHNRRMQDMAQDLGGVGMAGDDSDSSLVAEDNGLMDEVQAAEGGTLGATQVTYEVTSEATSQVTNEATSNLSSPPESVSSLPAPNNVNGASGQVPFGSANPVSFFICPNADFEFDHGNYSSDYNSDNPLLVIQTPLEYNPIEIRCMDDVSCVFRGGSVHLLINNNLIKKEEEGHGTTASTNYADSYPITISGITFKSAQQTSIQMNDPRGKITFQNCNWEDNQGTAAIEIDGTYVKPDVPLTTTAATGAPLLGCEPSCTTATTTDVFDMFTDEDETTSAPYPFDMGTPTPQQGVAIAMATTATTATMSTAMSSATATATATMMGSGGDDMMDDVGGIVSNLGRRERKLWDDEEYHEDYYGNQMLPKMEEDVSNEMKQRQRRSLAILGALPRSIVSLEECSFNRNKGNATIMVSSYSDELTLVEQDPGVLNHNDDLLNADYDHSTGTRLLLEEPKPLVHSIHLAIKNTTFSFQSVDTSIIDNLGGRLQSSGCVFANNTAESIIRSEDSTVAMTATQFINNDIRGTEGLVVLDRKSAMEKNDGTCLEALMPQQQASSIENNALGSFVTRQANVSSSEAVGCKGIMSNGVCNSFEACGADDQDAEDQPSEEVVIVAGGCFTDWVDLVDAVRDRPYYERDFVICPNAKLIATAPVVIEDSDYITIKCGTDEEPSKNCEISGGFSHFQITGSSSGVQLARLKMIGSTGSSIMALGSAGSTLNLVDCEWSMNQGASAILVHHDKTLSNATGTLDVMSTLGSNSTAMSVDVTRCLFEENELTFGAIANVGGTLSVDKTMFSNNAGNGGDIVVTSKGTCTLRGSCFDSSASVKPGVIFIENGSQMTDNTNNFGVGITAGGYDGGTCTGVFQEAEDADCLGSASCSGNCIEFLATSCSVDLTLVANITIKDTPSTVTKGEAVVPVRVHGISERPGSSNIVPIVVATVITAFAVFGLVGIIFKRHKSKKPSTANIEDVDESPGRFACCKRKKKDQDMLEAINPDEELFDDDDDV